MRSHFAILGDGAWGTAIALVLAQQSNRRVTLWSARAASGQRLRDTRENPLLPGVPIPPSVELTCAVEAVAGADLHVIAIPTAYLRETLGRVALLVRNPKAVVSLTKGLEH